MTMAESEFDQVSHMCTILAVGVYRGHDDSQLSLKNGIASSDDLKQLSPEERDQQAYRQAMDWIGNCFVQTSYGDVIAIATTIDKSTALHKITFHISNNINIGPKRTVESKKEVWPAFLKIMNAIHRFDPFNPEDLHTGSQMYVRHIIETGWSRIVQKFSSIQNISNEMETKFTDLLEKLRAGQCITAEDISLVYLKGDTDSDQTFLNNGIEKLQDKMKALLKVTRKSRSNTAGKATVDAKLEIFNEGISISRPILLVINSILIKHKPENAKIWEENQDLKTLILKIHNRLSRLLKFESGAKVFVHDCLGIYQKFASLSSKSELQFEVSWVEDCVEISSLQNLAIKPMTYNDYLSELDETKNRIFENDMERLNKATYDMVCRLAKEQIEKKRSKTLELAPSLHCEISLAFYLEAKQLTPLYNFIGVTKLNCVSCSRYSQSYFKLRKVLFQMTGSSGKWHHNWFMPIVPAIKDADPGLLDAMKAQMNIVRHKVLGYAELELKTILSNKDLPGRSVGSDSSTGSMNPILLQEV